MHEFQAAVLKTHKIFASFFLLLCFKGQKNLENKAILFRQFSLDSLRGGEAEKMIKESSRQPQVEKESRQ